MDINKVKELVKLLEESKLNKLEIRNDDFEIKMSKQEEGVAYTQSSVVHTPIVEGKDIEKNTINAPVVGTFYTSPASDKEPYVKIGQRINIGDTVCIIEAMKVMSEITADKAGTVVEIMAANEQLVEFDQPLFVLE